ncbi:Transferase [Penicillium concentricum]|uniref:Transferase n=1 Tax=Penicillium concentricum TaxID=293559 RepID=A0A9W9SSA4_9EURO|nr:Transferase [Penicillium concentricum]KAJ5382594.1 Transferase [Penicillium concentricum]
MSVAVENHLMKGDTAETDSELHRDIISQFPLLNAYTQLLFGFKLPANVDRDAIVASLQGAFDKLKAEIPWLGWQVARESGPGGILKAMPWPTDVPEERIRVKNCDDLIAPMAKLVSAGVPIHMLDGSVLTPWPALPQPRGLEGPDPVVALQANFVSGGLILNLSSHHTIIDGSGIYQFVNLLALVMSGKEIPAADLEQANRDRSRVIPLIPRSEPVKSYSHLRRPPGYTWAAPSSPPMWCYFKMPVNALARLVKSVKDDPSSNKPGSLMVSENDIFSAFAWQRLCAVRVANGQPPERSSKLGRAIDGRMAMGVPLTYMGHMVCHALVRLPLNQVAKLPLPQIAQALRRELNQANTPWSIRSFATFMAREPDTSTLLYGGTHDARADLMVTATGQATPLPTSWGPLLGRSCFFRRPTAAPIPGCLIINEAEGAFIPLTLCMPEEDINGLKKDPVWKQYVRYVG